MKKKIYIVLLVVILCLTTTINALAKSSNFVDYAGECKYVEYMEWQTVDSKGNVYSYYDTIYSNGEFALYYGESIAGVKYVSVLKTTDNVAYDQVGITKYISGTTDTSTRTINNASNVVSGWYNGYEIIYHSMPIFNSRESAQYYLDTGIMTDYDVPSREYNAEELTLSDMRIQVFDSNSYDNTYIEFYYQCDSKLIGSNLEFNYTYTYACSETITKADGYGNIASEFIIVPIEDTRGTIRVYIKDLKCINDVLAGMWFNNEPISKRNVMGYGGKFKIDSLLYTVDTSKLDIVVDVASGATYGNQYVFDVDLINGKANKYTNTPDADGNYTYNNDYEENDGNYVTVVDKDDFGNTSYTYYYYDYSTNNYTEVNEYPSQDGEDGEDGEDGTNSTTTNSGGNITNTNNNNPIFNNDVNVDVNVSDDDINVELDNIITDNVKEDDTKNFLALFLSFFFVLENNAFLRAWGAMFGWLPLEVQGMIFSAIAIGAGIGLYKLFKR